MLEKLLKMLFELNKPYFENAPDSNANDLGSSYDNVGFDRLKFMRKSEKLSKAKLKQRREELERSQGEYYQRLMKAEREQISQIEEALAGERQAIQEIRSHWFARAMSTQPCNRQRLESAIIAIYRNAGTDLSRRNIIWFESAFDVVMAAIILRNIFDTSVPYPSKVDSPAWLGGASFGPNPDFFENRLRCYWELKRIPHREQLARMILDSVDTSLSIRPLARAWNPISRALATHVLIDEEPARAVVQDPPARILCSRRLASVESQLQKYLSKDQRSRLKSLSEPWRARNADNPAWMFENYFHSPLANASELMRIDALRAIGFDIEQDTLFRNSVEAGGWWVPFGDLCLACDNPVGLSLDNVMRLHDAERMAIEFQDGSGIWALRGLPVSPNVAKGEFTARDIDKERNIEIRRVMIDNFGIAKYIGESGVFTSVHDETGVLYCKSFDDDEMLKLVKVINKTAEPDGSFRTYFLRVPPHVQTPTGAVAWTFGLQASDYVPLVET